MPWILRFTPLYFSALSNRALPWHAIRQWTLLHSDLSCLFADLVAGRIFDLGKDKFIPFFAHSHTYQDAIVLWSGLNSKLGLVEAKVGDGLRLFLYGRLQERPFAAS